MGAAARPVQTKRPSRRAIEAAGGQIPAAPSTKRPGRIANADRQAQAPAVVGMAEAGTEAAARSAARSGRAKRRRTPSSPPKKRSLLRSHTLTLDPCSNRGGKRAGSKLQQEELPGAKRPRSTDLPCPSDNRRRASDLDLVDDAVDSDVASGITDLPICPPDNNNRTRACARDLDLLDDAVDTSVASAITDPAICPPDNNRGEGENSLLNEKNNNIWRDLPKNLLLRIDSPAPKRPCPPDNNNNNWRDWANLADGPAGLIAERVLSFDVADYVRFRAVCRPWWQSSTEPRTHNGLDRRFHPWRWTMLREERAVPGQRCCFLNTSTGECVKVDIPELHDHKLLALTPEGLLVLAHDRKYIRLLNPLTRHLTELPPLTTLVPPRDHHSLLLSPFFSTYFAAWGSGIAADDSTFVLCFNKLRMLGLAKPGEDRWTVRRYQHDGIRTAPVMIAGRFYCVTRDAVMVLGTGPNWPLLQAAKLKNIHVLLMADSLHLVNNCGEVMLVHHHLGGPLTAGNKSGWRYDTYRLDADTRTLLPVKSLGGAGRALFMGMRCSLSVSLDVFPSGSISADTIYLSFDFTERDMLKVGGYHLADGSVEQPCSLLARPYTLVDYLSLSNTVKD